MSGEALALEDAPFPGEWSDRGACRRVPTADFFPGRGDDTATVKAVCCACPVVEECRAYALDLAGLKGIWGGLSDHERTKCRRQAMVPEVEVGAAPPPVPGPQGLRPGQAAGYEGTADHDGRDEPLAG